MCNTTSFPKINGVKNSNNRNTNTKFCTRMKQYRFQVHQFLSIVHSYLSLTSAEISLRVAFYLIENEIGTPSS